MDKALFKKGSSGWEKLFLIFLFVCSPQIFAQTANPGSLKEFESTLTRAMNLKYFSPRVTYSSIYYNERLSILDSLLTLNPENLSALNERISIKLMKLQNNDAWKDFVILDSLTRKDPKFLFVKGTLLDYFGAHDSAIVLYEKHIEHLENSYTITEEKFEKADILLGKWYILMYLIEEDEASEVLETLYNEYRSYTSIGINSNYFSNRFGDGVFNDYP